MTKIYSFYTNIELEYKISLFIEKTYNYPSTMQLESMIYRNYIKNGVFKFTVKSEELMMLLKLNFGNEIPNIAEIQSF